MHKLDTTSGHLPYYKQIKEFYKKDIQDGVLAVGDRVDSEYFICYFHLNAVLNSF